MWFTSITQSVTFMNNSASFSTLSDFFRVNTVKPNEDSTALASFGLTALTLKKSDIVENDAALFIKFNDFVIDVNHILIMNSGNCGPISYECGSVKVKNGRTCLPVGFNATGRGLK